MSSELALIVSVPLSKQPAFSFSTGPRFNHQVACDWLTALSTAQSEMEVIDALNKEYPDIQDLRRRTDKLVTQDLQL
jgi:hypothetical protein